MHTFEKYCGIPMPLLSYKLLTKCLVLLHCELAIILCFIFQTFAFCELKIKFLLIIIHTTCIIFTICWGFALARVLFCWVL